VTEKTIADKLAIEPKTKVWLSDAVHLELAGELQRVSGRTNGAGVSFVRLPCSCAHGRLIDCGAD
jgi:hypothetical protein